MTDLNMEEALEPEKEPDASLHEEREEPQERTEHEEDSEPERAMEDTGEMEPDVTTVEEEETTVEEDEEPEPDATVDVEDESEPCMTVDAEEGSESDMTAEEEEPEPDAMVEEEEEKGETDSDENVDEDVKDEEPGEDLNEPSAEPGEEEPAFNADLIESGPSAEACVEVLLFASSSPVNASKLAKTIECDAKLVEQCIEKLNAQYEAQGRTFRIKGVANGYQMMTRSRYFPVIQKLVRTRTVEKLTQAGLETLAIIAYKQPITRADVEAVRGVQSGAIIRNLLERRLVRVVGRDSRLGHPMLYGTSKRFLEIFGLKSLKELPSIEELKAF